MSNGVSSEAVTVDTAISAVDPIRTALNSIVTWSLDAATWQRDALRRLYAQQKLSAADVDELYVLCRQAHSLLEADETPLPAHPLEASHVPASWNAGGVVALKSIGHAKNVNALADDQTLNFAETGLTIIYGDNGAGKSGYGRVLKRACRARDQEDILTNAYGTPSGKPSARIKFSVGGAAPQEVTWQDSVAAPPDLSNISVFDSKCASVHVGGPNELAYTPVPLQLLQALADISRDFAVKLKTKKTALEGQLPSFLKKPQSREGTTVHRLILGLSATTSIDSINSLAQMSDLEKQRLEQLKSDLAADPTKEIRKLKALKQRLEDLIKISTASDDILLPAKTEELRQLLVEAADKATAAQLAATEAFNKEPLPQAGSEVWKTLWDAAREFSKQEAYPDQTFPNTGNGAVCVLCQQQLSPDAATRLAAFETFVQQKVHQTAEEAQKAVQVWKNEINAACPEDESLAGAVRLLRDELDEPVLCGKVARTLAKARVRCQRFLATNAPTFLRATAPIASVTSQLEVVAAKLEQRIAEFENSSDPVQRALLENELHSLEDRVWLASIQSDVEAEIERLKKIVAFEAAMQDTDTNRITRKTTELSKSLVTNTIRDAFAAESTALSISDRRLELTQEPSGYGSTKFKVSLVRNSKAKVASVLSEGEHRCVALAAFLAELSTAHNCSGVIFDDPVSSLDHNYRGLVASRLAKEAASGRQVIVFTHDIPFLMMLDEAARAESLQPHYQCVNRADDKAGICIQGAPSKAQPVLEIVDKIERRLANTRILHSSGRLDEWADQVKAMAGLLRDGWERSSEFAVSHVVRRFGNKVHTGGLRKLTVLTDADCDDLKDGYGFCCTYCHTDPDEVNRPTPTPVKIEEETNRLRNWFDSVRTRQEQKG